jgi:RHS repeat-associated protein
VGNENYEYDPYTFRVTRIYSNKGSNMLQDLNYYYDPVGNITYVEDNATATVYFDNTAVTADNSYTYDALYRLIEASGRELRATNASPGYNDSQRTSKSPVPFVNSTTLTDTNAMRNYTQKYGYDEVGNIMYMRHLVGSTDNWTREFTIDVASNRLLENTIGSNSPTIETYTYDNRGNIISGFNHMTGMDYNALNRLEHIEHTSTTDSYYQYDGAGQRVRKVWRNSTGTLQKTRIYVNGWELYIEKNYTTGVASLKRHTVQVTDGNRTVMQLDLEFNSSGSLTGVVARLQYTNHLGSATIEVEQQAGNVISYEEYYPYGGTSFQSKNTSISQKRYRYTGKERDEESGFYYHGARYYVPWLARWCACDPMQSEMIEWSPYNYSYDNPIKFTDKTGMQPGEGNDDKQKLAMANNISSTSTDKGIPESWRKHLPADKETVNTLTLSEQKKLSTAPLKIAVDIDFLKSSRTFSSLHENRINSETKSWFAEFASNGDIKHTQNPITSVDKLETNIEVSMNDNFREFGLGSFVRIDVINKLTHVELNQAAFSDKINKISVTTTTTSWYFKVGQNDINEKEGTVILPLSVRPETDSIQKEIQLSSSTASNLKLLPTDLAKSVKNAITQNKEISKQAILYMAKKSQQYEEQINSRKSIPKSIFVRDK